MSIINYFPIKGSAHCTGSVWAENVSPKNICNVGVEQQPPTTTNQQDIGGRKVSVIKTTKTAQWRRFKSFIKGLGPNSNFTVEVQIESI